MLRNVTYRPAAIKLSWNSMSGGAHLDADRWNTVA
jgi:hypothetical protein